MKRRKGRSNPGDKFHKPEPEVQPPAPESVVTVELADEPYAEFAHWLEGRLKGLEARFSHMITPRSRQTFDRRRLGR